MGDVAVRAAGLGKQYRIGVRERGYTTFREALARSAAAPFRRLRRLSGRDRDREGEFWALRDVGFEVTAGEVVGVIGRNGAGKSTLLKVLSQIVEPTAGEVELNGRVGSLLEVGTGFHPELTGRENVFLNGAILGMSRREVARKFDAIVDFSEIGKFLDTPVKRYSSGMYTRLAFAVAAHLEPEILIVDEVLAVGDAQFQEKCLGKMQDVARGGRTVLFVSHNMAAIEGLCDRCVVLDAGRVVFDGAAAEAVRHYIRTGRTERHGEYVGSVDRLATAPCVIAAAAVRADVDGQPAGEVPVGAGLLFTVDCWAAEPVDGLAVGIGIENRRGVRVATLHTKCAPAGVVPATVRDRVRLTCRVPRLPLVPGEYVVRVAAEANGQTLDYVQRAFQFTVLDGDYFGNAGKYVGGVVFADQEWATAVAVREDVPCGR